MGEEENDEEETSEWKKNEEEEIKEETRENESERSDVVQIPDGGETPRDKLETVGGRDQGRRMRKAKLGMYYIFVFWRRRFEGLEPHAGQTVPEIAHRLAGYWLLRAGTRHYSKHFLLTSEGTGL